MDQETHYIDIMSAIELESVTARAWNNAGTIRVTEYGTENTYYVNEFNHLFYCKNYPTMHGIIRHSWGG